MLFRKTVSLILIASILTSAVIFPGCAGRQANPIPAYYPGDEKLGCKAIDAEINQLETDMQRLLPGTDKFLYNSAMFVGGMFLLVPFFFMDLKDAEKVEWEAMRVRRNRLLIYAVDKDCECEGKERVPIPPLDELRRMQRQAKQKKDEAIPQTDQEKIESNL